MGRRLTLTLALLAIFGLVAAACGNDDDEAGDTTTTEAVETTEEAPETTEEAPTTTVEAPTTTSGGGGLSCTEQAIAAGIAEGGDPSDIQVDDFDCESGWAYAVYNSSGGPDTNVLLQETSTGWAPSSCPSSAGPIPAEIYQDACEAN